jgi:hypothetical protein
MNEEITLEEWFDIEMFDVELDEYLTQLFSSVEETKESNINNFYQYE